MVSYGALAILAFLVGANAATEPCSKQIESEMKCMLSVTLSPDAKTLKERVKQVMKTCAPNIPAECHAQKEAAMECATTIFKNADTDADLQATKKISGPAVDQCFEQNPPDVKRAFFELFMSHGQKPHRFNKKWHKRQHNDTSSSGESSGEVSSSASGEDGSSSNETSSSFERKHRGGGGKHGGGGGGHHRGGGGHGGGGRGGHGRGGHGRGGHGRGHRCRPGHGGHHGPRNLTASASESSSHENNTSSSSSGSSSKGKGSYSKGSSSKGSGSSSKQKSSGERHGVPPQCRKTKEQMKCVREEMKKLGKDSALVDTINTVMGQKNKCKQLVSWSCSTKSWKTKKCIFKATKPCRQAFIGKLKTCLQEKGFTLPPFMMHGDHTQLFTTPLPTH